MPNEVVDPAANPTPVPDEPQVLAEAQEHVPFEAGEGESVPDDPQHALLEEIAENTDAVRSILEHFEKEFFKPKPKPRKTKKTRR